MSQSTSFLGDLKKIFKNFFQLFLPMAGTPSIHFLLFFHSRISMASHSHFFLEMLRKRTQTWPVKCQATKIFCSFSSQAPNVFLPFLFRASSPPQNSRMLLLSVVSNQPSNIPSPTSNINSSNLLHGQKCCPPAPPSYIINNKHRHYRRRWPTGHIFFVFLVALAATAAFCCLSAFAHSHIPVPFLPTFYRRWTRTAQCVCANCPNALLVLFLGQLATIQTDRPTGCLLLFAASSAGSARWPYMDVCVHSWNRKDR